MADGSTSEGLADMAYNTDPHWSAEISEDSKAPGLADVACDSVSPEPAGMVHNAEYCRPAEVVNNSGSDVDYNGDPHRPAEMPNDSAAQVLADVTYESVLQEPADMVRNVEPCEPAERANDSEQCERTDGDFCEFQYIEIVPLDSPIEAAQTSESCANEVKEEIKQEPEDVCNI